MSPPRQGKWGKPTKRALWHYWDGISHTSLCRYWSEDTAGIEWGRPNADTHTIRFTGCIACWREIERRGNG